MPVMEKLRMFVAQEPVVAASCLIAGIGQYLYLRFVILAASARRFLYEIHVPRLNDRDIVEIGSNRYEISRFSLSRFLSPKFPFEVNEIEKCGEILVNSHIRPTTQEMPDYGLLMHCIAGIEFEKLVV
ncbi:hypothetical protein SASPL_138335 [Salvia splendens]|uniref:Uncharacterized protein n=1 Tax=Salvia splendens TaxID=180675 RepID=A0A8X8WWQ4_SALSN|nr:hypothetical protein SASPL_138335 [Salvia splendens]